MSVIVHMLYVSDICMTLMISVCFSSCWWLSKFLYWKLLLSIIYFSLVLIICVWVVKFTFFSSDSLWSFWLWYLSYLILYHLFVSMLIVRGRLFPFLMIDKKGEKLYWFYWLYRCINLLRQSIVCGFTL